MTAQATIAKIVNAVTVGPTYLSQGIQTTDLVLIVSGGSQTIQHRQAPVSSLPAGITNIARYYEGMTLPVSAHFAK